MMHRPILAVAAIFVAILLAQGTTEARLMRAWTYGDLFKESTLVVIAHPVKTTPLNTVQALPGISTRDRAGNVKPVKARIVETQFVVTGVLKGKATTRKLTLRHMQALVTNAPVVNGPGFVAFAPADRRQFLMFLKRAPDGSLVATSGQTDPDQAIEPLRHRAR